MYSYKRLPASSLHGLDMFNFHSYWDVVKNKINDLQQLGSVISLHQQKIAVAKYNLLQRGRKDLADSLDDELAKIQDDLDKWWKVKGYIDKYLPQWMQADQPGTTIVSNLSILPIILGAVAIAALAYVVNTGMALLQDYQFKKQLTAAIIENKMTSGQAAEVLSVPREKGVLEEVVGKVGLGLGFGIPTMLLVAGGIYVAYASGMLKGVLGSFGGGSSSSSSGSSST